MATLEVKHGLAYDENGEVYVIEKLSDKINKEQKKKKKHTVNYENEKLIGANFVNLNNDYYEILVNELTTEQLGKMLLIPIHFRLQWKTGRIEKYGQYKITKAATEKDIKIALKMDDSNHKSSWSKLKKKFIELNILTFKDGGIYFNSNCVFFGTRDNIESDNISAMVTTYFKQMEELRESDLALLYKMQKFIHCKYQFLCMNPNAETIKDAQPLQTMEELSEALKVKKSSLYRQIKQLQINNSYVFAKVSVGSEKRFYISDNAFYKGAYGMAHKQMLHDIDKYSSIFKLGN